MMESSADQEMISAPVEDEDKNIMFERALDWTLSRDML
jgi:hypothetical protein